MSYDLMDSEVTKVLPWPDQLELLELYKSTGKIEYRNKLIECNMLFVISVARKLTWYLDVEYNDYVAAGVEGMIMAIEKYDISTGTVLITYARNWVERFIKKQLMYMLRTFRLPNPYNMVSHEILELHNAGHSNSTIAKMLIEKHDTSFSAKGVYCTIFVAACASIEQLGDDTVNRGKVDDSDCIEHIDTFKWYELLDHVDDLETLLPKVFNVSTLNARHIEVLKRRYGIGCVAETLESVSQSMNITRERVRQIEAQAITRIREELGASGSF